MDYFFLNFVIDLVLSSVLKTRGGFEKILKKKKDSEKMARLKKKNDIKAIHKGSVQNLMVQTFLYCMLYYILTATFYYINI